LLTKNIDPASKDKFGRTPLWLAAKKGHPRVVKLIVERCKRNGIGIPFEDLVVARHPAEGHQCSRICDICTLGILDADPYHNCRICRYGDFDICQECIARGAFCLDYLHKLVKRVVEGDTVVEVPD